VTLDEAGIHAAATQALELIADGARIGLGSGRAAAAFIAMLGDRVREGLEVSGVVTSAAAADLARQAGVTLIDLGEETRLDLTVDGADEVAPNLDLIKGRGGALVRERIVAAASARQVIVVSEHKLVPRLGARAPLPVEVIPFARGVATRELRALGLVPALRMDRTGRLPLFTENGNLTLDCAIGEPPGDGAAARELERALLAVPGVVDTGLFLGTADLVLVGHADGRVDTLRPVS
jgi:ribose 5-phosphate isomerase A